MKQQVPDRKRQRREYILKKQSAYVQWVIGGIMLLPAGIIALISAITTVVACACYILTRRYTALLFTIFCGGIITVCSSFFAWMGYALVADGNKLSQTPYVPPVTPDTLPANEVLVRGAQPPPVVPSEVLLRAAQGEETPKEELLRVAEE
jgi:hypothetical protein